MRVWITKYALTTGIFEMEVESQSEDGTGVYGKRGVTAIGRKERGTEQKKLPSLELRKCARRKSPV